MKAPNTTDPLAPPRLPERLLAQMASLRLKKQRAATGLFLLEGSRLVIDALKSGAAISFVVVEEDRIAELSEWVELCVRDGIPVYSAAAKQFRRLTDTVQPQGMAAAAVIPGCTDEEVGMLCRQTAPVVALHDVADPGNLGAIIRSMDWFGVPLLLLSRGSVDPWNPKVVRSAMGSMLRVRIGRYDSAEALLRLANETGRTVVAAVAERGTWLPDFVQPPSILLLFGSEAHGLPSILRDAAGARVTIPGTGGAESLNLAMSAAIILYAFNSGLRRS